MAERQNLTQRRRIARGLFIWEVPIGRNDLRRRLFTCKWGGRCNRREPVEFLHALHVHEWNSRQAFLRGEPFYDCPGDRPA